MTSLWGKEGVWEDGYLIFRWRIVKAHVTDHLIGAEQKIPGRPVKTKYLGDVEAPVKLGTKP